MVTPLVSVMIITYNHATYIRQSIMSVLEQETDFPFVINVIDDCSTDGAQDIIRELKAQYPDKIELFINKKNIGYKVTQKNFYRGFQTLTGKYVAILEGDDYWSDNTKLAKQVAFLEQHVDFVACAHNVLKIYEGSDKEPHLFLPPPEQEQYDIHDLINITAFFHTSTILYRNVLRGRIPPPFRNKLSCDLFITMAHAQYGKIKFFPEAMSVYRAHANGRFSGLAEAQGWMFNIEGYRRYNKWLGYKYRHTFNGAIYRYCEYLLRHGKKEGGLTDLKRVKYTALMHYYKFLFEKPDAGYFSLSALSSLVNR